MRMLKKQSSHYAEENRIVSNGKSDCKGGKGKNRRVEESKRREIEWKNWKASCLLCFAFLHRLTLNLLVSLLSRALGINYAPSDWTRS